MRNYNNAVKVKVKKIGIAGEALFYYRATPSYKLIFRYLSQSNNQKAAEAIEVNIHYTVKWNYTT